MIFRSFSKRKLRNIVLCLLLFGSVTMIGEWIHFTTDSEVLKTQEVEDESISPKSNNGFLWWKEIGEKLMKMVWTSPQDTDARIQTPSKSGKPGIDMVNDYHPFVDFKFVLPEISPRLGCKYKPFLVVLVNSGAKGGKYRRRRHAIRATWGNRSNCEQRKANADAKLQKLKWLLVFVVGKGEPEDDEANAKEAQEHNDMLIGNITDNYINNVIKLYMGLLWASRFNAQYTLKADDDVYVRIPRVLEYLVNEGLPKPFYGGSTLPSLRVQRSLSHKLAVSWKYYGDVRFPPFNVGAFYVLSSDLHGRLISYATVRKPFHVDDAYIGVATRDLGVKATKMKTFQINQVRSAILSNTITECDFLAIHGYGHGLDAGKIAMIHGRLDRLLCGNVTTKCN